MRIDIQAIGFDLTEGLREHTERRLQFALNWASHDVRTVTRRLERLREHHHDRRQGAEAADGEPAPDADQSARTSDAH